MPPAKYSCPGSPDRFLRGNTANDSMRGEKKIGSAGAGASRQRLELTTQGRDHMSRQRQYAGATRGELKSPRWGRTVGPGRQETNIGIFPARPRNRRFYAKQNEVFAKDARRLDLQRSSSRCCPFNGNPDGCTDHKDQARSDSLATSHLRSRNVCKILRVVSRPRGRR